jgi:hypothetical protein
LFLLLSLGFFYWAPLVFPLWVLLISLYILRANYERPKSQLEGSQEKSRQEIALESSALGGKEGKEGELR